jgi:hypothetical protein
MYHKNKLKCKKVKINKKRMLKWMLNKDTSEFLVSNILTNHFITTILRMMKTILKHSRKLHNLKYSLKMI